MLSWPLAAGVNVMNCDTTGSKASLTVNVFGGPPSLSGILVADTSKAWVSSSSVAAVTACDATGLIGPSDAMPVSTTVMVTSSSRALSDASSIAFTVTTQPELKFVAVKIHGEGDVANDT